LKTSILLIDDSPSDIELTTMALNRSGMKLPVVVKSNGKEALEWLFEIAAKPDAMLRIPSLVLLDVKMPGIDGFEVLKRIRENPVTRLIPVVMFSSSREDSDLLKGYHTGANAFVLKPTSFTDLVETARRLREFWLEINEPPSSAPDY
jgi:two-component system, response regulator